MTEPAIVTQGLSKRYGDFLALDQVDLEVRTGEILGFLGPNGAGKSTAIKILLDQVRPSAGTASVLGLDARRGSAAIRARVGYLPGDLSLYPRLTGQQTLEFFAGMRGGVNWEVVTDLATRFDADLSKRVGEYSTGNRQKIGLIQAFMHEPELLILDEPNAGLDPLLQETFHTLLEETRAQGRTVFLSSHTLSEVERVADRVGIIRAGQVVVTAGVSDLKATAIRLLDIEFAQQVSQTIFDDVATVHSADFDGTRVRVTYEGEVDAVVKAAAQHRVVSLSSRESDLEEIFLTYYRDTNQRVDDQEATDQLHTNPRDTLHPDRENR
ncbi:MAG: ABC transporter ATP-binding protein [Ornithinimicrobium sp.]